jgi:hypothetical protein
MARGHDRQLQALLLSPFTGQTLTTLICSENTPDLLALTKLIDSGHVRPVIDQTYPLSQTPAAIQYKRGGHAFGKVVINLEPRWEHGNGAASRPLRSGFRAGTPNRAAS